MDIIHQEDSARGRYFSTFEDGSEGELTYVMKGDNLMIINHVGVPPQHRGNGLALQLVVRAVEDAREQGLKIQPLCPYAAVQFRRHPEWTDVLG